MKTTVLRAILIILAIIPIGLATKDPNYIPLASAITPTAITAICQLSEQSELKKIPQSSDKQDNDKTAC